MHKAIGTLTLNISVEQQSSLLLLVDNCAKKSGSFINGNFDHDFGIYHLLWS